jgi:hypothetical protein
MPAFLAVHKMACPLLAQDVPTQQTDQQQGKNDHVSEHVMIVLLLA